MKPFKRRKLDPKKPVFVYRNLHGDAESLYSIRQGGLVVAHTNDVLLENATFVVNKKGWERCLREGRKNVHAFVRGRVISRLPPGMQRPFVPFHYDRKTGTFRMTLTPNVGRVYAASFVRLTKDGPRGAGFSVSVKLE